MIPYYREVENLDNFSLYLKNIHSKNKKRVRDVQLPLSFYEKYQNLFKEGRVLDEMLKTVTFDLIPNYTYEEWQIIGSLSDTEYRDNLDYLNNGNFDIYNLIKDYRNVADSLQVIFPPYKEKLKYIKQQANEAMKDIIKYTEIVLEDNQYVEYNWPNAWYITPSNYLYNSGGEYGHKEGNFKYPFYELIDLANKKEKIIFPKTNRFSKQANNILNKGYVSESDFLNYSNLKYKFINIETRETEFDKLRFEALYDNLKKYEEKNGSLSFQKFIEFEDKYFNGNLPEPIRSYQKNIITLTVGYLKAKNDYYDSLIKLNNSKRKDVLKELMDLVYNNITDFLVRYCGFSKVETTLEKTITTTRLNVYDDFYEYLKRGWNIHLISPIIYDKEKDKIEEINLHSPIINNYLESQEEKNKDLKGKVLVI